MGIIRSQSIKSTIITYIGFSIGAINMMFVMPHYLSPSEMGLISVFAALAAQMVTLGSIGMVVVVNKFLPYYNAHLEVKKRDLITIILIIGSLGMILVLGLTELNKDFIIRKFGKNAPLLIDYLYLLPSFAFGYFFYSTFDAFNNNYKFTVWSSFVRELFFKSFNLLTVIVFAFGWLSFHSFMNFYSFIYWFGAILIAINLIKNKHFFLPFKVSKLTNRLRSKIISYALPSWGINILGVTSQFVDTFAIAGLLGLGQAAIYNIARLIISPCILPSAAIINISIPFLSNAWRQKDIAMIETIYKKSALVLFMVGGGLFFLIWSNIDDVLHLLPDKFYGSPTILNDAKFVILFFGLARLCDFATSVNGYILQNSKKYYLIDLTSNIFLISMMIPLNYFMIKKFGILGAGYANFIAFFIINGGKALFLYSKEKIHPFTKKWLLLPIIFFALLFINYLITQIFQINIFLNFPDTLILKLIRISLRSAILAVIIIPLIYKLNISEEINDLIDKLLKIKTFKTK